MAYVHRARNPSGLGPLLAWPVHVLVLALAVALAYGHTLDVPFYLDDFSSILENSLVYHWQGFAALRAYAPMRVLTYASFALNHRWGGFDPVGYHLVNLAIHFLAGVAVYGFTRGVLRTPHVEGSVSPSVRAGVPLFVSLVFLLHPLQTGAVTYIVQRLASMAALFCVAAHSRVGGVCALRLPRSLHQRERCNVAGRVAAGGARARSPPPQRLAVA